MKDKDIIAEPERRDLVTDKVSKRIKELISSGDFNSPKDYSIGNALNSAWVVLNKTVDRNNQPALKVCSTPSIFNSLLDMVVQGLNLSKNQCYLIVFGTELKLMRSYFGTQTVLKRILGEGTEIISRIVYKGDVVKLDINKKGKMDIISHSTSIGNINSGIIEGCYVKIYRKDEHLHTEYMSLKDIKVSWTMNAVKKGSTNSTQEKFPTEFAKRTVINRACKNFVNTSDDKPVLTESFNRTTNNEFVKNVTPATKEFGNKEKGSEGLLERISENEKSLSGKATVEDSVIVSDKQESAVEEQESKEELIKKNAITPDGEIIDDGTFIDDDGIKF